jgi:hypothetical protein
MKKMEQDKKKLLLELNNNETIRNDGEKNIFASGNNLGGKNGVNNNYNEMSFGSSNNNILGMKNLKEKKNKKKVKKEKKINSGDTAIKIKENIGADSSTSLISGNKGKKNKKNSLMGNGLSRNIFSVRNNSRNNNSSNMNGTDKDKNNNVIEII